jgi:acyl carrier protein
VNAPTDSVLDRVLELAAGLAASRRPVSPGPETSLVEGGFWLDSLALLELLVACEETFGVCLDPADLTPDRLQTAGGLAALVASRLAEVARSRDT